MPPGPDTGRGDKITVPRLADLEALKLTSDNNVTCSVYKIVLPKIGLMVIPPSVRDLAESCTVARPHSRHTDAMSVWRQIATEL